MGVMELVRLVLQPVPLLVPPLAGRVGRRLVPLVELLRLRLLSLVGLMLLWLLPPGQVRLRLLVAER
jgi:hypothetical protein